MARFSKKKLLETLEGAGLKPRSVGYETYGRDTRAYLRYTTLQERGQVESLLTSLGQKVNKQYSVGSPVVEVGVSYFKAYGWDL